MWHKRVFMGRSVVCVGVIMQRRKDNSVHYLEL